jgi:putative hydrolase of the HAD superfamily
VIDGRNRLPSPAMQHIRAITLDLDDTLWEIAPVIRRAEAALWRWLEENFPDIPGRFTAEAALEIRERVMAEHVDRCHDLRFLRRAVLGRMAEEAGYGSELVEPAFSVFDAERNRVELYPDVVPALTRLARRFTVIAITNVNANLETIGIRHLFADIVTAVDAGAAKPAPEIFEYAVARSGVSPAEIAHVGDHPEIDVAGAAGAGLATVWMNRRGIGWPDHLRRPDAIVSTVDQLCTLLDAATGHRASRRV